MTQRVQRSGFSLNAVATGEAKRGTILLSSSLGTGLDMWAPQRAALEATHRVIGYDTRGHGASDTPPGPYSFDDLVDDALAVLDHFEVERAAFIGLSIGGMTGLGLGLRAPDRLTHLICACARADNPPAFVQSWDDRMAIIASNGVQALWPKTSQVWLTPDFQAQHPDQVASLEATFKMTTDAGYCGCAEALKTLNYLPNLSKLTMPTLYIAGAVDVGAPPDAMQAMAAATPIATYVEIPGAAHIANLNQPQAFTAQVQKFMT